MTSLPHQGSEGIPALSVRDLEKSYPDFSLGPLSFDLEPGRVLAFVGPNGAGKTTTLNTLAGLLRPDGGSVEIFGRPALHSHVDWKEDVGLVGDQQGFFRNWSVRRNLHVLAGFYPRWSATWVDELVDRFELPMEKKVKNLSEGNAAKLALVAALGHQPKLLLLDEPTSGLDPVVRSEVLDVLWEILEDGQRAIFYSTHILSDISRLADELLFLRDGRTIQRSTQEELTESWRQISFRLDGDDPPPLEGIHRHRRVGTDHQVLTSRAQEALGKLRDLGAENLRESRLPIEEIATEILRSGKKTRAIHAHGSMHAQKDSTP